MHRRRRSRVRAVWAGEQQRQHSGPELVCEATGYTLKYALTLLKCPRRICRRPNATPTLTELWASSGGPARVVKAVTDRIYYKILAPLLRSWSSDCTSATRCASCSVCPAARGGHECSNGRWTWAILGCTTASALVMCARIGQVAATMAELMQLESSLRLVVVAASVGRSTCSGPCQKELLQSGGRARHLRSVRHRQLTCVCFNRC